MAIFAVYFIYVHASLYQYEQNYYYIGKESALNINVT